MGGFAENFGNIINFLSGAGMGVETPPVRPCIYGLFNYNGWLLIESEGRLQL
jgi:hypothetical protein